jgi:hypothetical protein
VFQISRRGYNQILRLKNFFVKSSRDFAVERFDGFRRSRNRKPERMIWKKLFVKNLAQEIFGRIFGHLDFFDDNFLLAL